MPLAADIETRHYPRAVDLSGRQVAVWMAAVAVACVVAYFALFSGPEVSVAYTVKYSVSVAAYEDAQTEAALRACVNRKGASLLNTNLSAVPQHNVTFRGSKSDQRKFETCLRALPGSRLSDPAPFRPNSG